MDECLQAAGRSALAAVAITNQRESVHVVGAPARAAARAVRRAGSATARRRSATSCGRAGWSRCCAQRTGLTIDPMFSASKARWLLDHTDDGTAARERGELCLGTVDSWVLWNLTGGAVHACDVTNASRTQLFNLRRLAVGRRVVAALWHPRAALPEVRPSSYIYGETARRWAACPAASPSPA